MTCYKCGLPTNDGSVEHVPFCPGSQPSLGPVVVQVMPAVPAPQPEVFYIDFDKIKTVEDLKSIWSALGFHVYGVPGNPNWEELKRKIGHLFKD